MIWLKKVELDAIIERCAGLDVHQETVVACVMYSPLDRKPKLPLMLKK
jgi:transposase